MSKQHNRLPHQLDPFRLAEMGIVIEGRIPLNQLRRLSEVIAKDAGQVQVELRFDIDELGVPCAYGKVEAELQLTCQRCLEVFPYQVAQEIALAWVRSATDIDKLPSRYEPYLVEAVPLILNDVIEEELLLAIPQVPVHTESECIASLRSKVSKTEQQDAPVRENPFAILAKLKTISKE